LPESLSLLADHILEIGSMKRRDFLVGVGGAFGTIVPSIVRAQSKPCPPPLLSIGGGESLATQCPAGVAPEWFLRQAVNTWSTPVINTIASQAPSPQPAGNHQAICGAWTGGCVDQSRGEFILAANGGHGDYAGNEVYACDIRSASPAWKRLSNPSTNTGGGDSYNGNELYPDGKPRTVHGWNRCVWGNGRVWYGGMAGMYPNGYYSTACVSWNRDAVGDGPFPVSAAASPWVFHGRIPFGGGSAGSSYDWQLGNAVFDPVTKRVWACAQYSQFGNHCYYVDTTAASPAPVAVNINEAGAFHSWGVIPHNLGRVWITKDKSQNRLMLLNLNNPSDGWVAKSVPTFSGSGVSESHGAVYHVGTQAIYCWHNNGASIVKISVPNDLWNGTYTVSTVAAAPGGVTPSAGPPAGTFSRFNIVEDMGNGQSALVLVNSVTGPVYVYKLPT
jgi:hypothetical protein